MDLETSGIVESINRGAMVTVNIVGGHTACCKIRGKMARRTGGRGGRIQIVPGDHVLVRLAAPTFDRGLVLWRKPVR